MFKAVDGELKVFNKTILSTQNNLKNLQTQTANLSYYTSGGNHVNLQNVPIAQPQTVSNFTKLNNAFKVYNGNLTKSTGLQNAYIKSVGGQNQALGNYLAGLNGAKASMGGYIASLVGAKAATIALQVASMALNMALSMGVAFAIQGLITLFDKLITTSEEQAEKLQNIKQEYESVKSELQSFNDELETTNQRISELEGKDKLTFTEGEELENLKKQNNELQRKIDLLELEEKVKNKEKNKTFVDTMNKSGNATVTMMGHATNIKTKDFAMAEIERYQSLVADGITEDEKKQVEYLEGYLQDLSDEWGKYANDISYIRNPTSKDDEKVNEWLDYIHDFQDKMAVAMGGDNAKENAFNRLVDNWKFDELLNPLQKLGKEGKVTLDDLKSRMGDPVFAEFVNKLVEIGVISDTTDGSLRYLANAFNGTATSARNYVTALKGNDLNNFIDNLGEEAKALGATESELAKLTAAHVIFNNTGLSTEQQQRALQALAQKIATTSSEMKYLLRLFNIASMDSVDELVAQGRTRHEALRQQANVRKYLKDKYGIDLSPIEIPEKEDIVPYTPSGDKDKGKDNTPDYEDPTDAIINRINLRAKELEQQEESIQNAIEIAELEKDYKKQISLTNDLIANRKKRVEELNKANAGLHNEAEWLRNSNTFYNEDGTESDENLWFDSLGNATEYYNDLINKKDITKEEREAIENLFENLSKYKKAYADNAEEIVGLNKEILQGEKDIANIREENYNEVLDEIQRYADEVSDYYDDINDKLDDRITKEESLLQIMQGQTDATSKLMDVQTEIDKAIRDSRISLQYLDKKEREGIFNEEDYNKLSKLVKSTQDDIDSLSSRFYNDVIEAYEQDKVYLIDSITAEYERQVAMKERELEIAQAQVDLTKKQIQLNNVLAEKNVKQLVERNGQYVWEWVADTDKVRQATEELMDAEAEIKRQEYEQKQQEAIDEQQRRIDGIKAEQAANDYRVEKMNEYVDDLGKAIENCVDPIKSFEELAIQLGDAGGDILSAFYNVVGSISGMGVKTSSTSSSSSGGSSGGNSWMGNGKSYDTKTDYMSKILSASNKMDVVEYNNSRNNKIDGEGMSETKLSSSQAIKIWESAKNKHADGTRYTPGGMTLMGEEDFEAFIDKNGHLIPIAQPTIGNIDSGGIVFNTEQMSNLRSLWDLSNIGKVNVDASMFSRTIPSGNGGTQNTFTGGIIINAPRDYNDFVRQLTQRIKTKSI